MSLEAKIDLLIEALDRNTAAKGGDDAAPAKKTAAANKPAANKTTPKKTTAKKGPTVDDLAERFGNYMKAGTKAEKAEAKANVMKIVEHFESDRITNIDPENFQEALDLLTQFEEGEDPLGGEEEDDGDDIM